MSQEKQLNQRLEKCWQIHQVLCGCENIARALNVGVDALAIFVNSQFDTPADRKITIEMCIERLRKHQENAGKF